MRDLDAHALDRHITRDQPEGADGEHVDINGKSFEVGTRVKVGGWAGLPEAFGVVTEITDLDGDVDDEGRSVAILPRVTVTFDEGDTEVYTTAMDSGMGRYADPVFTCEEIEVVEHEHTYGEWSSRYVLGNYERRYCRECGSFQARTIRAEPDESDEGPTGLAAFYSARHV